MKPIFFLLVLITFSFILYSFDNQSVEVSTYHTPIDVDLSKFPKNEAAFELGRFLFYSPSLSKKENTSCATCHLQSTGFAHVDHQLSHGTNGTFSNRNAPALVNLIWKNHFMWDGRIVDLQVLSKSPITSEHEMDASFELIIPRLENLYKTKEKFARAFGDSAITEDRILTALTYFMIELKSFDSKYDKVMRNEKGAQFTKTEARGLTIFRNQCTSCHTEPLLTNNQFESNGIAFDYVYQDRGRMEFTHKKKDSMLFVVPSLRNVALSFPYMHDGRFETLDDVLNHYQHLKGSRNKKLTQISLSNEDKECLKQFLYTLTDTSYITNPRLGFPPNDI